MSKKESAGGLVYSTNKSLHLNQEEIPAESIHAGKQLLRIELDRKHRAGKTVTLVSGYVGSESELEKLGKMLKNKCGTGGSVKDRVIVIQGDFKTRLFDILSKEGFKCKLIG